MFGLGQPLVSQFLRKKDEYKEGTCTAFSTAHVFANRYYAAEMLELHFADVIQIPRGLCWESSMNPVDTPRPYPLNAFHLGIKNAAEEVIRQVQAPDALVAMAFLTSMSASAQGLFDVRLPTGQVRPVSLNLLTVAESGERKTAVDNLVSAPLYSFDKQRVKKHQADLAVYDLQKRIWQSVDKGLQRQIAKLAQEGLPIDELSQQIAEHTAAKPTQPRLRRIMRQNATHRAIMDAFEGDGEAVAFMGDEGEIITKGGVLNQIGMLNKVWDGAPLLTLDRSERVSVIVQNPRVTVSYMVQTAVLEDLLEHRGDIMRGSGHWARNLIGWPSSTQGSRYTYHLDQNWHYLPKFHERVAELLDEFGRRIDAGVIERTVHEFSDEAIARWIELMNHTEALIAPVGYLHDIKDFASKRVEITGRIAALLHVFSKQEGKISVDTLNRAVEIVGWHQHEFKRIFSPPPAIPQELADAQQLEHYLHTHYWCRSQTFAQKNLVLRNGPVRPSSHLEAALTCLMAQNKVSISIGQRKERFIMLNAAYFGTLANVVATPLGY